MLNMNKNDIENESVQENLLESVGNDYTKDALVDLGDSLLDSASEALLDSDVLTKLPVLGGIIAFSKGVLLFRDRSYVRKLLYFLSETSGVSEADKEKYRKKLESKPQEAQKAGAVILDVIDKVTSAEKAAMVGKVMRAFIREEGLAGNQVIQLAEMIEKSYLSDLQALARPDNAPGEPWNDVNLESVGIKKPMRVEDVNLAIRAAIARLDARMPVVHEAPVADKGEPMVFESGFTEAGTNLHRILREY